MTPVRLGGLIVGAVVLILIGGAVLSYNRLVDLDQRAQAQWAQVDNAYQRRADLVPNLVQTVKGAANFERETLREVIEARSKITQGPAPAEVPTSPDAFRQYQQAQDQLGASLSRLLVVAEQYPQLTATQNFRDLQAQLEGTENRIAVERMRYNEAARAFNTARSRFPTAVFAGMFGSRFAPKQYFHAQTGAATPPRVEF